MTITETKPINYLNNKDILKEIHLSKNSYCVFSKPEYHQYDLIIDHDQDQNLENNLTFINNDEVIEKAKEARAHRLSAELGSKEKIKSDAIEKTDLIFRVMSWDHIPLSNKPPKKVVKKKNAKDFFEFDGDDELNELNELDDIQEDEIDDLLHIRVNFPPFQHYKFDEYNNLICVGKSHWSGDLKTGEFSKDKGQITKKLAKMYLMLCDRYALRFNWRGYSYVDEMKASAVLQLTYIGLRFNEAKSQNPFAYYTAVVKNSYRRVLQNEKKIQTIRDDILEINNLNPSWSRQQLGSTYEE